MESLGPMAELKLLRLWLGSDLSPEARGKVVACIGMLVSDLRPLLVLRATDWLAASYWGNRSDRASAEALVNSMSPRALAPWVEHAVSSIDRSGYVRQEGVRALGTGLLEGAAKDSNDKSERAMLGFLVVRLNDWVPEVRSEARGLIQRYFELGVHDVLAWALPYAEYLRDRTRTDHGEVLGAWTKKLSSAPGEAALVRAFEGGDRSQARAVARELFRLDDAKWSEWSTRLAASDDAVVASLGLRLTLTKLEDSDVEPQLHSFMDRPSPTLRVAALRALVERFGSEARTQEQLETGLWDGARGVREVAQFHVGKVRGRGALAEDYLAELGASSRRRRSVAASGLGETGDETHAARLREVVESETGRLASSALEAYSKVVTGGGRDFLVECLRSPCDSVGSAAVRLLAPKIVLTDEPWITAEIQAALVSPTAQRRTLRILRLANRLRWDDRLRLLCAVAPTADEAQARQIQAQVDRIVSPCRLQWHLPVLPASENLAAIREGLGALSGLASPQALKTIQWLVDPATW